MGASVDVVLIGGRSGVGKTSVALAIHEQLAAAGIGHANLEGDYLDMAFPPPPAGFAESNLRAVWARYRDSGYRRLVYSQTVSVLYERELLDALEPVRRSLAVLLTTDDESARERLEAREVTSAGLATHLERSTRMARRLDSDTPPSAIRVDTTGRAIVDVASQIVELTGWMTDARS